MPDTDTPEGEEFHPLPPETPLLTVLATMARQCRAKTGRAPGFIAIPRKLALPLAGERAEQKMTIVEDGFARACLDGRITALLMAVPVEPDGPAIPVLAIDMPSPLAAAWPTKLPRFAENEGFEEHPTYAACPFSRLLWDKDEATRIPQLIRKILAYCHDIAKRKPAPVFQPVMGQHDRARPLAMSAQSEPEALPDDPSMAWATIEAGLDAHGAQINAELAKRGAYGIEFDGELAPDIVGRFQAAFAERFKALIEYGPHPYKPGWYAMVATPISLETGS